MSANFSRKGFFVMRKLPFACLSVSFLTAGIAHAAPKALLCPHEAAPDPTIGDRFTWENGKKTKNPQDPQLPDAKLMSGGCFYDDVFLLSGDEMVPNPKMAGAMVPLVTCPAPMGKTASFGDCYLVGADSLLTQAGAQAAATLALSKIKAGNGGNLPEWDEIVVFTADFGPTKDKANGPLFFRMKNAAGDWVNGV